MKLNNQDVEMLVGTVSVYIMSHSVYQNLGSQQSLNLYAWTGDKIQVVGCMILDVHYIKEQQAQVPVLVVKRRA